MAGNKGGWLNAVPQASTAEDPGPDCCRTGHSFWVPDILLGMPTHTPPILAGLFCAALLSGCATDSHTTAQLGLGFGNYDVDFEGGASDSTSGALFELAFESVPLTKFGGGVRARGIASDDNLDADPSDGVPGTDQASDAEWFLHGTYDGGEDGKRLPVRMGLGLHSLELEETLTGESLTWSSFGPRVEFAPMLPFHRTEYSTIGFAGLLGLGYGITTIEDGTSGIEWDTNAFFLDVGLGLRGTFQKAMVEFGYRYHSATYDESDPNIGLVIRQLDTTFSGFVFSFGLKF